MNFKNILKTQANEILNKKTLKNTVDEGPPKGRIVSQRPLSQLRFLQFMGFEESSPLVWGKTSSALTNMSDTWVYQYRVWCSVLIVEMKSVLICNGVNVVTRWHFCFATSLFVSRSCYLSTPTYICEKLT